MAHGEPGERPHPPRPAAATSCPPGGGDVVVCHLGRLTEPDLTMVGLLARVHLSARRHGQVALFCHAPPDLVALLDLVGLDEILHVVSGVEPRREPEQREEAVRAEKRVHRRDLPG